MESVRRMQCTTRRFLPVVLLAVLVAVGCGLFDDSDRDIGPDKATSIVMTPVPDSPAPGDLFDITFRMLDARDIVVTPFKLLFDPATLRFDKTGSVLGPFLQSSGRNVVFLAELVGELHDQVWVALSILAAPPDGGVNGDGDLCTLRFQVLPGTTATSFSITPFDARIFGLGIVEQPVVFPSLTRPLP